jgi:hypothetical protein
MHEPRRTRTDLKKRHTADYHHNDGIVQRYHESSSRRSSLAVVDMEAWCVLPSLIIIKDSITGKADGINDAIMNQNVFTNADIYVTSHRIYHHHNDTASFNDTTKVHRVGPVLTW